MSRRPSTEANYVLEQIKDYPLSYPVIFDWEDIEADARTDGMDSVQLTKNAIAFCDTIEQAGYRAGVYFNQRFGYEEFDLESLQDYVFWLAEYNDTPSFSFHFQIWQYCNDGRVDGIKTDVDLNLAFLRAKPKFLLPPGDRGIFLGRNSAQFGRNPRNVSFRGHCLTICFLFYRVLFCLAVFRQIPVYHLCPSAQKRKAADAESLISQRPPLCILFYFFLFSDRTFKPTRRG